MVAGFLNISDFSLENKIKLETAISIALKGMSISNKDGTGIVLGTQTGNILLNKSAHAGAVVAEKFALDPALDYKHVLLHTRLATMGAPNDLNAHPHESKTGYLVHNGWCPELFFRHKESMKTGCDTEALAFVFNEDMTVFDKELIGNEHFALLHMDNRAEKVVVANKNKSLYKAYSTQLSAHIVLTSSSIIQDIGKMLNEELSVIPINDNNVFSFDGKNIIHSEFKFKDIGWDWNTHWHGGSWRKGSSWEGERDNYKHVHYPHMGKFNNNKDELPKYVRRMTRRERKQWIKENKRKREDYIQFWMDQQEQLAERLAEEPEGAEYSDGFSVLDYLGNPIAED